MTPKEYDALVRQLSPKSPIWKDTLMAFLVGGGLGSDLLQMAHQGGGVSVHFLLAVGQGVKIAVAAFLPAEGDVDVQPQRLRGGPGHSRTRGGSMVTAS